MLAKMGPSLRSRRVTAVAGAILLLVGVALALSTGSEPAPVVDGTADERVGTMAPDLSLESLDGPPLALADLRGKVVAVDFWATYCGPCVRTMPHLQHLVDTLPPDRFALYSVNVDPPGDDRRELVRGFLERSGLSFPVVLDTGRGTWLYGATRIPLLVIVDGEGVMRHVFRGFVHPSNIDRAIEELLAEG